MSNHNICFCGEIIKILILILRISTAMTYALLSYQNCSKFCETSDDDDDGVMLYVPFNIIKVISRL